MRRSFSQEMLLLGASALVVYLHQNPGSAKELRLLVLKELPPILYTIARRLGDIGIKLEKLYGDEVSA
jgi:hypothetical protein